MKKNKKKYKKFFIPRIYYSKNIISKKILKINEKHTHYLLNVLKKKIGDKIELFTNSNYTFLTKIEKIIKNNIYVLILKKKQKNNESLIKIHLGQMIKKKKKCSLILEKSVELGINEITIILSTKKEKKYCTEIKKKKTRWEKIIIQACAQTRRNKIPTLNIDKNLKNWIEKIPKEDNKLFFCTKSTKTLKNLIINKKKKIWILIGPEKGLSEEEHELTKKKKFIHISLGKRILRSETASIVSIAAIQLKYGDLQ